jgi:hypothetical protein
LIESKNAPILSSLTPRQKLHRRLTALFFILIVVIVISGVWLFLNLHPETLRYAAHSSPEYKAGKLKVALLVCGMIACVLLSAGLMIVAWLEFREIQRKELVARRDIWREIADQSRGSRSNGGT